MQRGRRRERLSYTNGDNDGYISLHCDGGGATGAHRWNVMTNANVDFGLFRFAGDVGERQRHLNKRYGTVAKQ